MNRTIMLCAAVVACAHAQAQTIYTGSFSVQNDTLVATGESDTEAMSAFLSALLPLYEPWTQTGAEIGSALASSGPLTITTAAIADAPDNFGEIGDNVNFNPLGTGGTADIATGGDYIDAQLQAQKDTFSVEFIDPETEEIVFKQEFGPVRSTTRLRGGGSSFEISWLALLPWENSLFETDENGLTPAYRLDFNVVPAPAAATVLGLCGLTAVRRRR